MSPVALTVKNGNIVTPQGIFKAGLAIDQGKIVMMAEDSYLPPSDATIDARGNFILPGIIDPHFHPGIRGVVRDLQAETRSAAAGGVTTAGAMNTVTRMTEVYRQLNSPDDIPSWREVFTDLKGQIETHSMIDLFLIFAITNDREASEIPEYASEFGVTSFKFYMHCKGGDRVTCQAGLGQFADRMGIPWGFDDGTVYLGFEHIGRLGPMGLALLHAENLEVSRVFFERVLATGAKDLAAWAAKSPPLSEAIDIRTYAYLAKMTNCPLYIVHLTSAAGLEEVIRAKQEGINITAETCPQYLIVNKFEDPPGVYGKVIPPIKGPEDNAKLWEGLRDGDIQCMGTDHVCNLKQDVLGEEVLVGEVPPKRTGFAGMETLLPALLSEGVNKGRITLQRLVEVCCENTAKTFGLYPTKGCLRPGSDADIVIVDLNRTMRVSSQTLHTDANCVFEGREFKGWPIMTILRGRLIYDRERDWLAETPEGRYLPRVLAG